MNVIGHTSTVAGGSTAAGGGGVAFSGSNSVECFDPSHLAEIGDFLDHIQLVLRDPKPIVRASAADTLSACLVILMA